MYAKFKRKVNAILLPYCCQRSICDREYFQVMKAELLGELGTV